MGKVVYQTGFVQPQQVPSVALASASSSTTAKALGLAIADIADGAIGQVRVSGNYSPIDTSLYLDFAKVYLSNTAGEISTTPGTIEVIVGQVTIVDLAGCIRIACRIASGCATGGGGSEGDQGVTGIQGATGIGSGGGGGGTGASNTLNMNVLGNLAFAGPLPRVNIGPELTGGPTTYTAFRARRGIPGAAGTTSIQLELNGVAVAGAILSWISTDVAYTLKSIGIGVPVIAGDRLSFRLLSREAGSPRDIYAEVNA
jgi:hypothetical protein